ncbi:unnamed protein product [Peronospora farinosa]|uniref:Katanin p80 WD40 repeat-containing subunit B1 homolog n=1 Tax=Peronospora farinosa TaxID=134698 RepID=A0AAV0UQV6_9STRA|nr:unnamed protein product [Peronospora farinosa]
MPLSRSSHFLAHSCNVNCLRFGRKSDQRIATGGDDNVVNIWQMYEKKMKRIQRLSGHQSAIKSIVFDSIEHKIVAGAQSGSIKVFDLEAGKVNQTLQGHMDAVSTVDYHLYGDYVASGSSDTIVKVWDLRTRSCMQTFKGHSSEVTAVKFTPDGRWLTSGDQDGVIRIWDLTAGRLLYEFPHHVGAITSLEFNPEEFILVSSAADRSIRFWDVQEFALIGVTPVDKATTTSMCHTIAEPYSGKYLLCCSQDAIRVWSYETAIECHDSIAIPRPKELGRVSIHADTMMTQDMKLMSGCIEHAYASVWMLDVMQLRPFDRIVNKNSDQRAGKVGSSSNRPPSARVVTLSDSAPANQSVIRSAAVATFANVFDVPLPASRGPAHEVSDGVTQATALVIGDQVSCNVNHLDDISPATPGVVVPLTGANSIPCPVRRTEDPRQSVDVPRPANARIGGTPKDIAPQQPEGPSETHEIAARQQRDEEVVTSDFVMELRCGMDTCVKAFKARQKHIQQLLVHWEKGRLNDGLRYIGNLPKGKREAVVVDVLRITSLESLGVDLEACVLLLPLIIEVLESKFELYLSVGVEAGHKLFDAFSPIVKDSRNARQCRSRTINFAGEERVQWCNTCDSYFQEMQQRVQYLVETCNYSAIRSKVHNLIRALDNFYRC